MPHTLHVDALLLSYWEKVVNSPSQVMNQHPDGNQFSQCSSQIVLLGMMHTVVLDGNCALQGLVLWHEPIFLSMTEA